MKNLLYILIFIVISLTSCTVEDGESNYYKTETGRNVFLQIESNISSHLFLIDMANLVNLYAQSTEEDRKGLSQNYLQGYDIIQKENLWILENQNNYWEFKSNGKALDELDAEWNITLIKKREDGSSIPLIGRDNFTIRNTGNKEWLVNISDLIADIRLLMNIELSEYNSFIWQYLDKYNKVSTSFSVVTDVAENKNNMHDTYIITRGKGLITNGISIEYELPAVKTVFSAQRANPDEYRMVSGEMSITVKLKDKIEDKITVLIGHNNGITIIENRIEEVYL